MKVYVVTSGSYSDYRIVGVFLDKTKAEFSAKFKSSLYEECQVETYDTLDDRTGTEPVSWVDVIMRWVGGNTWRGEVRRGGTGPFVPLDDHDGWHCYYIQLLPGERDRDEVYIKIAQDRHAQWQAEREGIA